MNSYQQALEQRKKNHLLRVLPLPPEGIDFYSNDYLGLAKSAAFSAAIEEELSKQQTRNGSTGSRLLSGNSEFAEATEQKIADFHNAEAALVYASGYTANVGLVSALATKETTLIMDELVHASLIDGARLGKSPRVRFQHNNANDLEAVLKVTPGQKIVIVESVYSMDGDICPVAEMAELCTIHNAMLIVDEAHSAGVFGQLGEGLVQNLCVEDQVTARIITYGKGPGIHGAAVVGPKWLRDYQVNFARSFIFSTAPSDHHFASISAFYDHVVSINEQRTNLNQAIAYFLQKRKEHGGTWLESFSQIQSLIIPGNTEVIKAAEALKEAGINALPIRKPSIPEGQERIRFCLHAFNTKEEIDLLFEKLR